MAVGSNTLGLLFKIGVDSKDAQQALEKLPQGLKTIEKSVTDMGSSFRSSTGSVGQFITTFGPVAGAVTAAAGALQLCIKAAIDLGSELHDLSQATGITVENLSAMRVAAATSGSSLEQLTSAFVRFEHAALEGGPTAQAALARFGLTAKDVSTDSTAAFDKFLKSFNQMGPTAERNADSMALFGRGAKELIPTFNELSGGMEDARKKAEALGLLFHDDLAKNADEAGDAIDILKLQINAIAVGLGQNLLPVIRDLVTAVSQLAPYVEAAAKAIGFLIEKTQNLNDLKQAIGIIEHLRNVLSDIRQLSGAAPEALAPKTFSNLLQQKADADKLAADKEMLAYLKGNATGDWSDYNEIHEQKTGKAPRTPAQRAAVDPLAKDRDAAQKELAAQQKQTGDIIIQNMEDQLKELNDAIIKAGSVEAFAKYKFEMVDFANFMTREIDGVIQDIAKLAQPIPGGGKGIPGLPDPQEVQDQLDAIHKVTQGGFFDDLTKSLGQSMDVFQTWGDVVGGILAKFAQAAEQAFAAFILTGKLGGQIFKQLVAQIIASLAIESAVKFIFQLAEGFAALAAGDYKSAGLHFASAKIYGTVAAVAGAVGVAIGASGGLGGGDTAGAAAGGGGFGGETAPGTITINQGATIGTLAIAVDKLTNKISSMSPSDVITVGAEQNPTAIGQANNEAARRDGSISREFLQISGLRTA